VVDGAEGKQYDYSLTTSKLVFDSSASLHASAVRGNPSPKRSTSLGLRENRCRFFCGGHDSSTMRSSEPAARSYAWQASCVATERNDYTDERC